MFTGWFDTGQQGMEWPGQFEIVPHEPPRTWKAARSVLDESSGKQAVRVNLRGRRPLRERISLRLQYRAVPGQSLDVVLRDSQTGHRWTSDTIQSHHDGWTQAERELALHAPQESARAAGHTLFADQVMFSSNAGTAFLVDDVLLLEPMN
jgi:hypothetical protein